MPRRDADTVTFPVRPVTVEVEIAAPASEVLAFVSDTRNDPTWCPNVTSVTQLAGSKIEPGARFRFHQSIPLRGRLLESDVDVEVVAVNDDSIYWRVEDKFQVRDIRLSVAPSVGGCVVTQRTTATFKRDPGAPTRWLYPLLAKRTFRSQFDALKTHFA